MGLMGVHDAGLELDEDRAPAQLFSWQVRVRSIYTHDQLIITITYFTLVITLLVSYKYCDATRFWNKRW